MKNLFENAYFGKSYKTRDGSKAIFICRRTDNKIRDLTYPCACIAHPYACVVEGYGELWNYFSNGRLCIGDGFETENDIISEWQEEINEEELDSMAWCKAREEYIDDYREPYAEGFKAGFAKPSNNKAMKAIELMIGDWVEIQDTPRYYKVEGIDIFAKGDACRLTFEDYVVETWCDRVKPIPLTEEILKANGFKFSAETGVIRYVYLTPKDSVFVEPRKEKSRLGENWFWFENGRRDLDVIRPKCFIPFVYVHQLQHALRLCGLQDLADNFKIQ